ncbi:hypothetical protein MTO96_000543 [Rhipicephalus appendiculatus]
MEVPLSQLVNAALQPDGIQLDACVDPTAHTAPHRQCFWLHVYDPPSHVTSTFSFIRDMPHRFNFSGCGGPGITMSTKKRFFCVMGVPLSQLVNAALQPDAIQHDTCVDPTAHTAPHRQCFWLHVYNPPSHVTSTFSFIRDMPHPFNFSGCGGPGITMSPKKQFFCFMEVPLSQLVNAALQPDGIQLDACVDPTAHTAPHRQCFWLHVYNPPSHVTSTFSFIRDMPHRFKFSGCGGPGMMMSPKKQFFCVMEVPLSQLVNAALQPDGIQLDACVDPTAHTAPHRQCFWLHVYNPPSHVTSTFSFIRDMPHRFNFSGCGGPGMMMSPKKQFFCVMEVPLSQLVNAALQPDGIQLDACVDPTAHTAPHRQCFWLHVYNPLSKVTSTDSFIRDMPHRFNFSGCGGPGITMSPKKQFFCVMEVPLSQLVNAALQPDGIQLDACVDPTAHTAPHRQCILASRLEPAIPRDFYILLYKGHAASLQLQWVWRTRHHDVA